MMRRSRRGDTFLLLVDLLFLTAILLLFWKIGSAFTPQRPDEPIGSHQAGMLRTYAIADAALLHLDTAARQAVQDAIRRTATIGGVQTTDLRCGSYLGFQRWSSPDGIECFPKSVTDTFRIELQGDLRTLPAWIIPTMTYDVDVTRDANGLRVVGIGTRDVTLPILLVREGNPRDADTLITAATGAVRTQERFMTDSRLPGTIVQSVPGSAPRASGSIARIIIKSAAAADTQGAIARYANGVESAHYLIDRDGAIRQLAPESARVRILPACDTPSACAVPDADDTSIGIAIVIPAPEAPADGACRTGWRDAPTQPGCWGTATDAQRAALERLVADIAGRRFTLPIPQERVLRADEVVRATTDPGPGLAPDGEDPDTWWSSFVTRASGRAALLPAELARDSTTSGITTGSPTAKLTFAASAAVPALAIPVADVTSVSSCFGWRTLRGGPDLHDGIDFPGAGKSVLAAADGIVFAVCDASRSPACDGPDGMRIGDFGNVIIIDHGNGLLTRYSHLSAVASDVTRGARVRQGQALGKSGETGNVDGAHLDFKVYTSADDLVELGGQPDKAKDPLCFFTTDAIASLSFNMGSDSCKAYGGSIDANNAVLRERCAGIEVQATSCVGGGTLDIASASPVVENTKARLRETPGLLDAIAAAAQEQEVDPMLVIAVFTQESKGDALAVSHTGCAGLGQFCMSTATGGAFEGIFGAGVRKCSCPAASSSCRAPDAGCMGDPRLDPFKTARATPLHLALDAKAFSKYRDQWRFAIASYNAGSGNIRAAIRASGKTDPTWEDTVPYLAGVVGSAKANEVSTYVDRVTAFWHAQGGETTSAARGTVCSTPAGSRVNVREIGSYTFRPSFSVAVPDALSPIEGVGTDARALYASCDGADGSPPVACVAREAPSLFGDSLVACSSPAHAVLDALQEFIADCRASDQSGCACAWDSPKLPDGVSRVRIDLYGTDASGTAELADGTSFSLGATVSARRSSRVTTGFDGPTRDVPLSILLDRASDGSTRVTLQELEAASGDAAPEAVLRAKRDGVHVVDRLFLRTDGVWVVPAPGAGQEPVPVCGAYKREVRLCVDTGVRVPTTDSTSVPVIDRFALYLQDTRRPSAPTEGAAAIGPSSTVGGVAVSGATTLGMGDTIGVAFHAPAGDTDISHYRIWCAPQSTPIDETASYTTLVPTVQGGDAKTVVRVCAGGAIIPTPGVRYAVRIVPYDIAEQRGEPLDIVTVDQQQDTGWTGIVTGFLEDGELSEEELLNAVVSYYTGGAVTTTVP